MVAAMDRQRVAAHVFAAGLGDEELDAVARVATEREFGDGETMMSQGDFGHCVFLVESGTAEVSVGGAVVAAVGAGDVVGEAAVLASGRRTASVVATSPLRAIALFKRDVWRLERDAPEAARRLRAAFDERVGAQSAARSAST
jgi:CPA1 family monovalent cation:H+ antiporter